MLNKNKLVQFYAEQYEQEGRKKRKKPEKSGRFWDARESLRVRRPPPYVQI